MVNGKFEPLLFDGIQTNSVFTRTNLVTIDNMQKPGMIPHDWDQAGFNDLVEAIVTARKHGRPVVWSMGAHVIKNGLSRYIIELVRNGILTHVSGNGASSIHDFELAFLGETSEDVANSIEDGSFGMWEETGRYMNEAIQNGVLKGLGYGASLAEYALLHPETFPYLDDCVFAQTTRMQVPYTCHISIGTDIIHQHPVVDFAALGVASGRDFETFCRTIQNLQGGVFLNFGSAVSGPLLFLRALAAAHNLGFAVNDFVVANFDIRPLTAANFVTNRVPSWAGLVFLDMPRQLGARGYHFHGMHQVTIPSLYERLMCRRKEMMLVDK